MKIESSKPIAPPNKRQRASARPKLGNAKVQNSLLFAKERGLLAGPRTVVVRGRMPAELVAQAKSNSGITSDSKLLEAALANLAFEDNYGAWLIANRGTISPDLDLDF